MLRRYAVVRISSGTAYIESRHFTLNAALDEMQRQQNMELDAAWSMGIEWGILDEWRRVLISASYMIEHGAAKWRGKDDDNGKGRFQAESERPE